MNGEDRPSCASSVVTRCEIGCEWNGNTNLVLVSGSAQE